ncbi:MAG: CDP-alcohol phosphatidyltransferase family protein [Akkermansiaceae bacterium]
MMDSKNYTYEDFWEMRGKQSMWFTLNVSYRLGAYVALWASKLGLNPNSISLLSAAITVFTPFLVYLMGADNLFAGPVLIIGLQLGYIFDCADGPLARVTGQGSSFGILMDKISDLGSGMLFPCVMAYAAGHYYCPYVEGRPDYTLRILLCVLFLRVTLSVWMWLKELVLYKADRTRLDLRSHGWWWRLKKAVGIYIDEPVYRLGISIAWIVGLFWEFIILYSAGIFIIIIVYILSSKKEMDAMDRQNMN